MKAILLVLPVILSAQIPIDKGIVELQGVRVKVSLSLPGFKKETGPVKLSDQHARLGLFASEEKMKESLGGRFVVSVIEHELPNGADLSKMGTAIVIEKIGQTVLKSNVDDGSFLQVKRFTSPNGLYLYFVEDHSRESNPYHLLQFYFEYINGGTWVELHMSMPLPANAPPKNGLDPAMDLADSIIRSIRVQKL